VDLTDVLAAAFAILTAGVVGFQLALAIGAPWGAYAMGGAVEGRFPPALRIAALIQAVVIAVIALGVLSVAGVAFPGFATAFPWFAWVVVALSGLAVVLNSISRSAGERRIWVPISIVLLASSLVVALDMRI
jgi:hypothetical protein